MNKDKESDWFQESVYPVLVIIGICFVVIVAWVAWLIAELVAQLV